MDDFGWKPEADSLECGVQLVFSKINVFVSQIITSGNAIDEVAYDLILEATIVVQSDEEESVGTPTTGVRARHMEDRRR